MLKYNLGVNLILVYFLILLYFYNFLDILQTLFLLKDLMVCMNN